MNGWIEKEIGDLFEFTMPGDWGSPPAPDNSVPVLRSTNFRNDGRIDFTDIAFRKIDKSRLEGRRIKCGDVLIEKSGGSSDQAAGRIVLCEIDFGGTCSNFIELARVNKNLDCRFVFYLLFYLYQIGKVYKYQQQTTGIINFKLSDYKREKIKAPALETEQARIADVLACLDWSIDHTRALIAKQQRIKTGLMNDLLTKGIDEDGNIRSPATHEFKDSRLGRIPKEWNVASVNSIGTVKLGRQRSPRHQSGRFEMPYLRVANVFDGWIDYSDVLSMDFTPAERGIYGLLPGDILLNEGQSLELVGRSALYDGSPNEFCFQNTLVRFRCFLENDPEYCRMVFKHWLDTSRFIDVARQTTSVAHLGADRFAKMDFARPDTDEQKRITAYIHSVDQTLKRERDHADKLLRMKTGLMQNLLLGEISVESLLAT